MAIGSLREIVIDCRDIAGLARFWHEVLGGEIVVESDEWTTLQRDDGGVIVGFQVVPEPKVVKNRVHLDVDVDDLDAAVAAAVALGATRLGDAVTETDGGFQVMLDPEGNEFCFIFGVSPG